MAILHLNISSFAIQVERLVQPKLVGRPVVVAASTANRAPLWCVSPEAYAQGIRKGMPLGRARECERRLICLAPNPRLYEKAQRKILEVVSRFTPVYETVRPGSLYLEMGGTELLWGRPTEAASKIRTELWRKLSLDPLLGVAQNKLVARVAAKVMRPHGLYEVFPGHEAEFLGPLGVEFLPGVGKITSRKLLQELGVRRIGDLAEIPLALLTRIFGRAGMELSQKARGLDFSEVRPALKTPALSQEALLPEPSNDEAVLQTQLWRLIERLGFRLRESRRVAGCGVLEGVYVDRQRMVLSFSIRPPSHSDFVLFECCRLRWGRFLTRRLRLKSLTFTLSGLQPEFEQLDFTADRRRAGLLASLDALRKKYGETSVGFAGRR